MGDTFKKVGDTVVPEEKKDDIGYRLSKARSIVEVADCIAESVISLYSIHNNKIQNIGEEHTNDELFIAVNGGWHFTTNTLFKTLGPTVNKILQKKN